MNKFTQLLLIAGACCIASTSFAQSASKYSGNTIEKRVIRMEKDLRILNKAIYKDGASPLSTSAQRDAGMSKAQIADFEIRLSSLEEGFRKVKGEVETLNHQNEELLENFQKLQEDIDFRFAELEEKTDAAEEAEKIRKIEELKKPKVDLSAFQRLRGESKADTPMTVIKTEKSSSEESAEHIYKKAFSLLKDKDFDKAEDAFSDFIEEYPNHKLAGNAQYWLAETFYVRGEMKEAMKQFAFGYKNYKDSSKASDNLLKLAITLGALDRKDDACITLGELETNYSPLSSAIANRMKNEKKKLNCGA